MKRVLLLLLVASFVLPGMVYAEPSDNGITIIINNEKLVSDVPAQSIPVYDANGAYVGDRTMLPIRAISEKLNFDVNWNEATKGIDIYRKNQLVNMWLDTSCAFLLDGIALSKCYHMDVPPTIVNDRTLVPVRAVAELLGAEVEWIGETKTVEITYELGDIEQNTGIAKECYLYGECLLELYDSYKQFAEGTLKGVSGKIVLTNGKSMEFKVYPELAPVTANNFINLAKSGFYSNTLFHRVIKDFVAQGGGLDVSGEEKVSDPISGEFVMNGVFNIIPHKRGTISLARPYDYNLGANQFFICHQDAPLLDGNYAAFGEITKGLEVLDEICNAKTDEMDKPTKDIVIKEIIINE